ncbi:MAG: hypothetical protein OXF79_01785, partial [Chloroflexi bacterium]|nr:hypothetical protein [Chloroflexota bacterium]
MVTRSVPGEADLFQPFNSKWVRESIHFSAKAVIRADLLFTLPGVLLVLMNGLVMVFDSWGGRAAIYQLSW